MIVLTGGAGFIGSCMLKKLNDEGINDILVVDNLGTTGKWKNLVGKRFYDYLNKDVFRNKLLNWEFGDSIKCFIHMGACTSTTESNASYLIENNFSYSKDLAKYAAAREIKFIYASSGATYGLGESGYSDEEIYDLHPLNCYGLSKQLFDVWVKDRELDKQFIGLKFFNVFGPNEYHKNDMASMIYKAYNQIKKEGKVKLFKSTTAEYGDGGQMRDFVYVKQVVDIMWQMYNNKNCAGIFNLGTGKARSWNDLAKAVFAAMNKEPEIEYIDMPEQLARQYQNFTEADMSKLKNVNCVDVSFPTLEESVKDYVQNHLERDWQNL